jgi:exopolysaccharide biosynthesis protein
VKIAGVVRAYNRLTGAAQRSFGVDADLSPMFAWVDADRDWSDAWHAVGSYPNLLTDGAVDIRPNKSTDFFVGRHPRTALGVTAAGRVLLVTVDGRTSAGRGMSIAALAQHMLNLGAVDAVNFDGGGSTTMWIDGFSINGIVNFPSDNGTADHYGERRVSDVLVVLPR